MKPIILKDTRYGRLEETKLKLICNDEITQFNGYPSVEQVLEKIDKLILKKYYFSHLIVDGVEIYDDPESYLQVNLEGISSLEIIVKTEKEFTNELLLDAESYIKRAKNELTLLADGFYQNPTSEQWNNFNQMMEGLQWINQVLQHMNDLEKRLMNAEEYNKIYITLQENIATLHEAVISEDYILTADIIQYELVPVYESLEIEFTKTIDTEGYRQDIN